VKLLAFDLKDPSRGTVLLVNDAEEVSTLLVASSSKDVEVLEVEVSQSS
jgi:hypothetical protein